MQQNTTPKAQKPAQIKCPKCQAVYSTRGFYARSAGSVCGQSLGVDVRKASKGFRVCRKVLTVADYLPE